MSADDRVPFDDPFDVDEIELPDDGAGLLDEVRATISRYVVLPSDEALTAVTLWTVATHAVDVLEHATRLCIHSPVKRCGKSRLLEVLAGLVHSPLETTNISVPALFRVIDKAASPPTLLLDEADRLLGNARKDEDHADLVALLNNGFRRGSPTYRCVGPKMEPTAFSNFAFAAAAGIGRLPDTVEDRGINVTMRRRLPGERVAKYRLRTDLPRLHELRDRLAVWVNRNIEDIEAASVADGSVPDSLEDRQQDAWEPLYGIAVAAGAAWPDRADAAAARLAREAEQVEAETLEGRLLVDIKSVFETRPNSVFVSTTELLHALHQNDDAPWGDADFTSRRLAQRLGRFGIKPRRNPTGSERGYYRSDFKDAFARYIASVPSVASDTSAEQGERSDASKSSDGLTRQTKMTRQTETAGQDMNLTQQTVLTRT
jgi:hypothetical protein